MFRTNLSIVIEGLFSRIHLGVNTLERHLLVDALSWSRNAVSVGLLVLVVVGGVLGLGHFESF